MSRVLIEFTADTEARARGTRMLVDPGSAISFCDVKKIATRITAGAGPAPAPVVIPVDVAPVEAPADPEPDDQTDDNDD